MSYSALRELRHRDAKLGDKRDRPAPRHHVDPWPCNFDPPAFPHPPGRWPDSLRRAWALWVSLWDDFAEDLIDESAGPLWGLYDALRRYGVAFDPRFAEAFTAWREAAARFDDDAHDVNLCRDQTADDCGTRGSIL